MFERAQARVTWGSEETEGEDGYEYEQECVWAKCLISGIEVGPIWGTHEDSVKRALATLSRKCTCGSRFHQGIDEEGNPVP